MKVLVVTNMAPFIWGGAEELATHLCKNLNLRGNRAELLRIPFRWDPPNEIPSQMLLVKWLEVSNADRLIALKFPAYLIRHEAKTLWILHQFRQAYDLYGSENSNIPRGRYGDQLRASIQRADEEAFDEANGVFVNSQVTHDRLLRFNNRDSKILPPPVNDPEIFQGGPHGDYVLVAGRVNSMKRQHLLVEALQYCPPKVRLVVAGPPDHSSDEVQLRKLVERHGLADRVDLDLGFISRDKYAHYVNNALAVAYIPVDEDSFGYVTMEAATASRAVITATDSGGILGLVHDGSTGWVAEPNPEALADALTRVFTSPSTARELGKSAQKVWAQMGITWDSTIESLLL